MALALSGRHSKASNRVGGVMEGWNVSVSDPATRHASLCQSRGLRPQKSFVVRDSTQLFQQEKAESLGQSLVAWSAQLFTLGVSGQRSVRDRPDPSPAPRTPWRSGCSLRPGCWSREAVVV